MFLWLFLVITTAWISQLLVSGLNIPSEHQGHCWQAQPDVNKTSGKNHCWSPEAIVTHRYPLFSLAGSCDSWHTVTLVVVPSLCPLALVCQGFSARLEFQFFAPVQSLYALATAVFGSSICRGSRSLVPHQSCDWYSFSFSFWRLS